MTIRSSADSPFIGMLKQTTTTATEFGTPRVTEYGYRKLDNGGAFVGEEHAVFDVTSQQTTMTRFDLAGRVTGTTDARGQEGGSTVYDGEGRVILSTDADGNKSFTDYDVFGRQARQRYAPAPVAGEPVVNYVTTYQYDEVGRVTATERRAYVGTVSGEGHLLSRSETQYETNADGRTEIHLDARGRSSASIYDAGGRLVRSESRDAGGAVIDWTAYEYDALGRTIKTTTKRGMTTTSEYDDLGRVSETTTSTGDGAYSMTTRYGYDVGGRQLWTESNAGTPDALITSNEYDVLGRLKATYIGDTVTGGEPNYSGSADKREFFYDTNGQQTKVIDEVGIETRYGYDEQGRQSAVTLGYEDPDHQGLLFGFAYDAFGQQSEFAYPTLNGEGAPRKRLTYYDDEGRIRRELGVKSDGQGTDLPADYRLGKDYFYDARGRLIKQIEGIVAEANKESGGLQQTRWIEYEYDSITGQMTEKRHSDERRSVYHYTEDQFNELTRVEIFDKVGSVEVLQYWRNLSYDPETGQLASVSTPEGAINYTYDDQGRQTRIQAGSGYDVQYEYDALGNLSAVKSAQLSADGAAVETIRYEYNALGRRAKIDRPNGVDTLFDYDPRGNVIEIQHVNGGTVLLALDYTRDARGIITQIDEQRDGEAATTWEYDYDGNTRLTQAVRTQGANTTTYAYTYDKASNRKTKSVSGGASYTYTYNHLDQLISENDGTQTTTYEYDAYGNLVAEKVDSVLQREYAWDSESHLTQARLYSGGALSQTIAFAYDDNGTRIRRQAGTASATQYLTDYQNPTGYSQTLHEYPANDPAAGRSYAWGDSLLAQTDPDPGNELAYLHGDHLGTVRLLTGEAGNDIRDASFDYTPFGVQPDGASSLTSYAFTEQAYDSALGLQYHRARWLNCGLGAWLSSDPVFDWPGNLAHPFNYASMSPTVYSDDTGEFSFAELAVSMLIIGVLGTIGGTLLGGDSLFGVKDEQDGKWEGFWLQSYAGVEVSINDFSIAFSFSSAFHGSPFGVLRHRTLSVGAPRNIPSGFGAGLNSVDKFLDAIKSMPAPQEVGGFGSAGLTLLFSLLAEEGSAAEVEVIRGRLMNGGAGGLEWGYLIFTFLTLALFGSFTIKNYDALLDKINIAKVGRVKRIGIGFFGGINLLFDASPMKIDGWSIGMGASVGLGLNTISVGGTFGFESILPLEPNGLYGMSLGSSVAWSTKGSIGDTASVQGYGQLGYSVRF